MRVLRILLFGVMRALSLSACGGQVNPPADASSDGAGDAGPSTTCTPEQPLTWAPLCLSSTTPTRVVDGHVDFVTSLAVDRGYLYWGTTPSAPPKVAFVERAKTSGDEVLAVAQIVDDYSDEISLTLNAELVVVATYNTDDQLFVVPRTCGAPRGVGGFLDVNSQFVFADESAAYVGNGQTPPYSITAVPFDGGAPHVLASGFPQMTFPGALDTAHLFVATDFGAISAVSLDGGAAALGPGGFPMAIDAVSLFAAGSGEIFSVPKTGGAATSLVPQIDMTSIAVDDTSIYWTNDSGVFKAPKSGGSAQLIAPSGVYVVVDDSCIYWVRNDGIWTAPK